jgi:hypothetical protein
MKSQAYTPPSGPNHEESLGLVPHRTALVSESSLHAVQSDLSLSFFSLKLGWFSYNGGSGVLFLLDVIGCVQGRMV